jgi:hypothetical protein
MTAALLRLRLRLRADFLLEDMARPLDHVQCFTKRVDGSLNHSTDGSQHLRPSDAVTAMRRGTDRPHISPKQNGQSTATLKRPPSISAGSTGRLGPQQRPSNASLD